MFIGKSFNYGTEVTATKGEQIVLWTFVLLGFGMIFSSIFFDWPVWVMIASILGTIFGTFAMMIFMIFHPKHRAERKYNTNINGRYINRPQEKRPDEIQEEIKND